MRELRPKDILTVFFAVAVPAALILLAMGQPFHCACADWWVPWSGNVWSSHNSQHLLDPYSFTHVCHGLLFFWIGYFLLREQSLLRRFSLALAVEAVWEIVENSPWVIRHYRENTISLDYFGDSVVNSIGDLMCCAGGFLIAAATPWWASVAVFALFEIGLLLAIRDNLILNILNLTGDHPSIVEWQREITPNGR